MQTMYLGVDRKALVGAECVHAVSGNAAGGGAVGGNAISGGAVGGGAKGSYEMGWSS